MPEHQAAQRALRDGLSALLLIGLGTAAAQTGHRVRYVLAAKLVNELVEAADERQLSRTIARYGRVELLCLDELGYMELDRRGAELLFQVLTEREEKTAVAIASNDSFSGWTKTFTDPGSAPPSSTDSPSAATSSRPAAAATDSPTPAANDSQVGPPQAVTLGPSQVDTATRYQSYSGSCPST